MIKILSIIIALTLAAVVGFMLYVRFSPLDTARWHIDLIDNRPRDMPVTLLPPGGDLVVTQISGAYADLIFFSAADSAAALERLDTIAMATPRTRRIAGSLADGHITWETRSRLWGFPDYTTAQLGPSGMTL